MKTGKYLERIVRVARPVTVMLDMALLVAALTVFVLLQTFSERAEMNKLVDQSLAETLNRLRIPTDPLHTADFLEELHDSEAALWNSFFNWYGRRGYAAGHCSFRAPNNLYPDKFHLFCTGINPQGASTKHIDPMQVLRAAKATKQENTAKSEIRNEVKDEPIKVRGWLDTTTGRKHFDPVAHKWLP